MEFRNVRILTANGQTSSAIEGDRESFFSPAPRQRFVGPLIAAQLSSILDISWRDPESFTGKLES